MRNETIRMELDVIRLKDMIALAQLRWFGHVTKVGDE
jgi:hypothetical protein